MKLHARWQGEIGPTCRRNPVRVVILPDLTIDVEPELVGVRCDNNERKIMPCMCLHVYRRGWRSRECNSFPNRAPKDDSLMICYIRKKGQRPCSIWFSRGQLVFQPHTHILLLLYLNFTDAMYESVEDKHLSIEKANEIRE